LTASLIAACIALAGCTGSASSGDAARFPPCPRLGPSQGGARPATGPRRARTVASDARATQVCIYANGDRGRAATFTSTPG